MIISVINHTNGLLTDEEVQVACRAINRQIEEDFRPYWSMNAILRLEGSGASSPDKQDPADMRGEAVIYLWDDADIKNALGYHDRNNSGIPYGFVFVELVKQLKESWTVTLSHEALEIIGDEDVNLLAMGPHPAEPDRTVFHWYEMCDAVQAETYEIDGVEVSNFVLPSYFTVEEEASDRNDYLGRVYDGQTLPSFGVNPGGYVGFFDPELGEHDTYSAKSDRVAKRRYEIKKTAESARRAIRYQRLAVNKHATPKVKDDWHQAFRKIEKRLDRLEGK